MNYRSLSAPDGAGSSPGRNILYMVRLLILAMAFLLPSGLFAQGLYLPPGSSLSLGNGSIEIPGSFYISTGATVIVSNGTIVVAGDFNQFGTMEPGTGTVVLNGNIGQGAGTTTALYSFTMNSQGNMTLYGDLEIAGTLKLLTGSIYPGPHRVILANNGVLLDSITGGPTDDSYVVTDSTGTFSAFIGFGMTFTYPVGTSTASTPVGVRNLGTDNRIDSRVRPQSAPGTILPVEWWLESENPSGPVQLIVDYSLFGRTPSIYHELLMRSSTGSTYTVVGQAYAVSGDSVIFVIPAGMLTDGAYFTVGEETLPKQVTIASVAPSSDVQSGEVLTITVALRLSDGSPAFATTNTLVGLTFADPNLLVVSGSTQAIIPLGMNSTTLTLSVLNTTTSDVTSAMTVRTEERPLLSDTAPITVRRAVVPSFTATAGTGAVFLDWEAALAQNVQSYRVYRGTTTGSMSLLREVAYPAISVDDSTVTNGTTYYYYLTTVIGGQESGPTPIVSVVPTLLTVIAPNGGEIWQVGLTKTIQWSTVGVADSIRIDYSANNGASWLTIASVLNTGSYAWLVPDLPSEQALIRITHASNEAVTDTSDAVFTVEPIAPPRQLAVIAGMQRAYLSWQPSVSEEVTGYRVYRGVTSGSLSPIATLDSSAVSFTDTGLTDGTRYYYALTTLVGGFSSPLSGEVSVMPSSFALAAPNGGEQWQAGLTKTITWSTVGEVSTVNIAYSTDAGIHWAEIVTSASNTGSYNWIVLNTPSTTALVRITDASNSFISDTSNSFFTIIELLPPANVVATSTVAGIVLTWNSSVSTGIDQYEIYHGLSAGSMTLLATVTSGTTSYLHAPLTDGVSHYYEVRSIAGGQYSRFSTQVWSIPTIIELYSPNGGEVFQAGMKELVSWGISGNVERMNFEYSVDNGATWQLVAQNVMQSGLKTLFTYYFEWDVPNVSTTTALVRVASLGPVVTSDQSDAVFSIMPVLPPRNATAVVAGNGINVSWDASLSSPVGTYRIYRGTSPSTISPVAEAIVPGSTLTWRDENVEPCITYYYAVRTVIGASLSDLSNVTGATIILPSGVSLTSPLAGTSWQVGTTHPITWTVTGCSIPATAQLQYSTNGGSSWTSLGNVPNTGSYMWLVPNEPSSNATIRIQSDTASNTSGLFTIRAIPTPGTLTATSGNAVVDLSWGASSAEGLTGYEIWRSTSGGPSTLLATTGTVLSYSDMSVVNCTSYSYTVRALVGAMVSAPATAATATPYIPVAVMLTSPSTGASWQAGTTHAITWSVTSCTVPATVELEYSTNGGGSWTSLGSVSNTGSYMWLVPNVPTSSAMVRIHADTVSNTSGLFTIRAIPAPGTLTATGGNGVVNLSWGASSAEGLTGYEIWRSVSGGSSSLLATTGTVLSYSDAAVTNCTSYSYTVRALVGAMASAPTAEATATPYTPATVMLTSPTTGASWQVATTHAITWSVTGCTVPATVELEYSTNGGGAWTSLGNVSNTGSYMWLVPNVPTSSAMVRIHADTVSYTSGLFTIRAVPAPGTLTATGGNGVVNLSWGASSAEGLTGYEIWRSTSGGPSTLLTTTGTVLSYNDMSVINCTSYSYTVRALVGTTASASTPVATATPYTPATVMLTSPTTGASWQVGTSHAITWTVTGCTVPASVTLQYSTNGGGSWTSLGSVPNTGSYMWMIPNQPTSNATVRIQADTVSYTSGLFTLRAVPAPATLTATGGDGIVNLSWTASTAEGLTGYALYRRVPGGSLSLIATVSSTATTYTDAGLINCSTYGYAVSARVGSIESALSGEVSATPYGASVVTISAPAGGESWQAGTTHAITWSTSGCNTTATVSIAYSVNAGTSWTTVATVANTGSYSWLVPNTPVANALIRVMWDTVSGVSNNFTIRAIAPPTGVTAAAGNSRATIRWTASTAEAVSGYEIYRGLTSGTLTLVGQVGSNATMYVDNGLTNGTQYYYAVKTVVGTFASAFSTEVSVVPSMPSLVLTYPNGGEVLNAGTVTTATWTSVGEVGNVTIDLSVDNGASWTLVATTANTGSYKWFVPSTPSVTALLRISADTVSDVSDAVFTIRPAASTAVNLRLMLQGPLSGDTMSTALQQLGVLPTAQPYTAFGYNGTETLNNGVGDIVDWVLLELRSGVNANTMIARRAVLLRADGQVVDTNGYPEILFAPAQVPAGSYYLVIDHRNHLKVMSSSSILLTAGTSNRYDFTTSNSQAYSTFQPALVSVGGTWSVPTGDAVHDGIVNAFDRVAVRNASGQTGYLSADLTLDGIVNAADRVIVRNNSFFATQVP